MVSAGAIVVATNTPVNDWVSIHTKQAAYRTYVIGMKIPKGAVRRPSTGTRQIPIITFVSRKCRDHEILIVGGEDHKTGQADDRASRFERLEAWTRERFPGNECRISLVRPGHGAH